MIASENIVLNSQAASKRGVLGEMIALLSSMDPNQVMDLVMAREKLGSTGIGHGIALPHGRMPGLTQPVITLLRHQAGVDFDAIDDQAVHIVVLLLVPDEDDKGHLDLLAQLARKLQVESFRQQILTADSCEAIADLFNT
ncbi:MAG: PTS sugar transporter subunit IIA [Mariprofundales bacterium]